MNDNEPITKEYINGKDVLGYNLFLKVDIPIWEEFAIGLIRLGGFATRNNFYGVRMLHCQVPNTEKYKEICIVTKNPKSQEFFEDMKSRFEDYKNVNIAQFDRLDKKVYVIEYEYNC